MKVRGSLLLLSVMWLTSVSSNKSSCKAIVVRKMNKEKFINYFKKKGKKTEQAEEIVVTKIISPATKEVTNAELRFVADEVESRMPDQNNIKRTSLKN